MKHVEGRLASVVVSPMYSFHPPTDTILKVIVWKTLLCFSSFLYCSYWTLLWPEVTKLVPTPVSSPAWQQTLTGCPSNICSLLTLPGDRLRPHRQGAQSYKVYSFIFPASGFWVPVMGLCCGHCVSGWRDWVNKVDTVPTHMELMTRVERGSRKGKYTIIFFFYNCDQYCWPWIF